FRGGPAAVRGDDGGQSTPLRPCRGKAPSRGRSPSQKTCQSTEPVTSLEGGEAGFSAGRATARSEEGAPVIATARCGLRTSCVRGFFVAIHPDRRILLPLPVGQTTGGSRAGCRRAPHPRGRGPR